MPYRSNRRSVVLAQKLVPVGLNIFTVHSAQFSRPEVTAGELEASALSVRFAVVIMSVLRIFR